MEAASLRGEEIMKLTGPVSWFGGPDDEGVAPDEGLAFIYDVDDAPQLFLDEQPSGTTGLARRLNPDVPYIACRWDYDETPRDMLLNNLALVFSKRTGRVFSAYPADWGPHVDTGRIADISPGLMQRLGIETDDEVEVIFPIEESDQMADVNPLVVDLSHWDPADDYATVADSGIVGVIYKATEGQSYTDPTYVSQQLAAKAAGLKWGAYHFADSSDVQGQIDNFMRFACPDPDELFCLDWEDNGGDSMDVDDVVRWIDAVETRLGRPGECVLYGGNTIKENANGNSFLTQRRLWLCQYGSEVVLPEGWDRYWLWQYTDGVYGPSPHAIDGIGPCDINSYDGSADQLIAEWATGSAEAPPVPPPEPAESIVNVIVAAPAGVTIKLRQITYGDRLIVDKRRRGADRKKGR
jgi:lysozyme